MFYEYEDKNADITKLYFSYYFICCIYLNISVCAYNVVVSKYPLGRCSNL